MLVLKHVTAHAFMGEYCILREMLVPIASDHQIYVQGCFNKDKVKHILCLKSIINRWGTHAAELGRDFGRGYGCRCSGGVVPSDVRRAPRQIRAAAAALGKE